MHACMPVGRDVRYRKCWLPFQKLCMDVINGKVEEICFFEQFDGEHTDDV